MGLRCPCKFRLGAHSANATVIVTSPQGPECRFTGRVNFSAEQCFTGGPNCNPAVNNFNVTFRQNGHTINLTKGRRGIISCFDHTLATLINGTAQGAGNAIPHQEYSVDFSYSIVGNTATVEISAVGADGTSIEITFTSRVSPRTFIGNCNETVGP
ncbi:hypothetical protein [Lederbergia citrea]|uniref:Uncharacterized protein n=1 Tax=Lederbergia citrea TaxID=2833581 RepID=A0A942UT14_9BACI|nr:hypothetical protein [Lederbergia citrea]MBS4179336.1 hypothetical protein [Lederbergia citrea]MBS4206005.1 hypothetical protein [Lederbergia citrea]MBS4224546.1 hypothetical protein [Lederbergia citrea]